MPVPAQTKSNQWLLLLSAGIAAFALLWVLTTDPRDRPMIGDEATHLQLALSIADGANMSYDAEDINDFADYNWTGLTVPYGLFYQVRDDGYALAKPYGYPTFIAPFIFILGSNWGVRFGNTAVLAMMFGGAYWLLRARFTPDISALGSVTWTIGSATWMYAFAVHTDLFLAALIAWTVAFALHLRIKPTWTNLAATFLLAAFAVAEKPTLALPLAPIMLLALWDHPRRWVTLGYASAIFAVGLAIALFPYLYYSDFTTWNPYSGDRHYASDGRLPFDPSIDFGELPAQVNGQRFFDPSNIIRSITTITTAKLKIFAYTYFGRHTGLLPFVPMGFILTATAFFAPKRRRWSIAIALGFGLYLYLYAMLIPYNYYGGDISLGSRYSIQAAPVLLAIAVVGEFNPRTLLRTAAASAVLAAAFLGPQLASANDAFYFLARTSPIQRLLPFEAEVQTAPTFACGVWPYTAMPYDEARKTEIRENWETCQAQRLASLEEHNNDD